MMWFRDRPHFLMQKYIVQIENNNNIRKFIQILFKKLSPVDLLSLYLIYKFRKQFLIRTLSTFFFFLSLVYHNIFMDDFYE